MSTAYNKMDSGGTEYSENGQSEPASAAKVTPPRGQQPPAGRTYSQEYNNLVEYYMAQAEGRGTSTSRKGVRIMGNGPTAGMTPAQAQQWAIQQARKALNGNIYAPVTPAAPAPGQPPAAPVTGAQKPPTRPMVTVPSYGGGYKQVPEGGLPTGGGLQKPKMGSIAAPLSPGMKAAVGIINPAAGLAIEGQRIAASNDWERVGAAGGGSPSAPPAQPPPAGTGEKVPERPPSVGLIEGIPANQWFQKHADETGRSNSASRPGGTIKPQNPPAPPPASNPALPPGFADVEKRAAAVSGAAKGIASTQALIDQTQKIITSPGRVNPAAAAPVWGAGLPASVNPSPTLPQSPQRNAYPSPVAQPSQPPAAVPPSAPRPAYTGPVRPTSPPAVNPASPARPNDPLIGGALPAGQSMQEQGYALPVPFAGPGPAFPRTNLGPPGFPVSALPPPAVPPVPPPRPAVRPGLPSFTNR